MSANLRCSLPVLVVCALLAGLPWPAQAQAQVQERRVPQPGELQLSYAPVVKRAAPAVVNVYAAKIVRNRNLLFDDPIFRRFFGVPDGGRPHLQRSLGSGVIVDRSGLVVTNVHVIEGADDIKIALADKREFEADVVLKDKRTDLAVLRIKHAKELFPYLEFADSDAVEVGDVVLAIGNPFGVGQTVTHGIISAVARTRVGITDYQFFIQTDAPINPGNSGGALVDMSGRLVGINTAIFSRSGGSQGVGFAIPSNMVRVVAASAESGGRAVARPWLGATLQVITPDIAESLGLQRPVGALVAGVVPDGPAAQAGLMPGDVIVAIDGQPVDDPNSFDYRFATKPLGGRAQLRLLRRGKEVTASVELRGAPEIPREEITIRSRSPFAGATVANLSPALAEELQIEGADSGVVILEVEPGSPADRLGFRRGDVIVDVNGDTVNNTRALARATSSPSATWRIRIRRGGQQITAVFSG